MRRAIVLGLLVDGLVGCKPKSNSDTKSLENFSAGSEIRVNHCSGDPDKFASRKDVHGIGINVNGVDAKTAEKLKTEAFIAMSAVPPTFVNAFKVWGGKLLITSEIDKLCSLGGMIPEAATGGVRACSLTIPITQKTVNPGERGLTIVIEPSAISIRHSLVRAMGYLMVQEFAEHINFQGDSNFSSAEFFRLEAMLTKAYLADLASSKVFSPKIMDGYLGEGSGDKIKANYEAIASGRKIDILEGVNPDPKRLSRLLGFVTAESFDSVHCFAEGNLPKFDESVARDIEATGDMSKFALITNSRKLMQRFFPRSFKAYVPVEGYLLRLANSLSGGSVTKGLGLADSKTLYAKYQQSLAQVNAEQARPNSWSETLNPLAYSQQQRVDAAAIQMRQDFRAYEDATRAEQALPVLQRNNVPEQVSPGMIATYGGAAVQGVGQGFSNIGGELYKTGSGVVGLAADAGRDIGGLVTGGDAGRTGRTISAAGTGISDNFNKADGILAKTDVVLSSVPIVQNVYNIGKAPVMMGTSLVTGDAELGQKAVDLSAKTAASAIVDAGTAFIPVGDAAAQAGAKGAQVVEQAGVRGVEFLTERAAITTSKSVAKNLTENVIPLTEQVAKVSTKGAEMGAKVLESEVTKNLIDAVAFAPVTNAAEAKAKQLEEAEAKEKQGEGANEKPEGSKSPSGEAPTEAPTEAPADNSSAEPDPFADG